MEEDCMVWYMHIVTDSQDRGHWIQVQVLLGLVRQAEVTHR